MDDIASIESVEPLDQISFWCLTISTMFKLVAMGVTIFVLPFNDWIHLERDGSQMTIIRGISGSDCVYKNANAKIRCTRWNDPLENREKFWSGFNLNAVQIERPSGMYRALFYFVLLQLLLFVFDIGASMVMCRRYRFQKDGETVEKRISMALTGIILFFHFVIIFTTISANSDFTNSLPPFDSCMGTAFKLFVGMFIIFGIGCFLTHFSRILLIREKRKGRQDFQLNNGGGRGAAMELM
uniref:Uncharacterized protein n=1 Tax=Meloidogyne enterolobii TaxID=390850 RepID=A0A6V7VW04_MELEN|nr:unnamed protein product [Meloidogyne enterolobii]